MEDKIKRIQELIKVLNKASYAYYVDGKEIMSNFEYDALYDELEKLEKETKIFYSNSPTNKVGDEVLDVLPKITHEFKMLSLNKTKDVEDLKDFIVEKEAILSWKLDGLTIVLTYENGSLTIAATRGNGEVGEVITNNAKVFKNIPIKIPYDGKLVIRGEAIITYSDFNKINEKIPEIDAKYKNPRNLCSGSVRQLDSKITKKRNVNFFAFDLVYSDDDYFKNSKINQLEWLCTLGFSVVEYEKVNEKNIQKKVEEFEKRVEKNDFPSDGLVLLIDDIEYGKTSGATAKFPRNAIAFKWKDETARTVLRDVEWSASRTGLINPIAIFDAVNLEGTNVLRASLHNISYIRSLKLGIGDEIEVYKANMIIPQIAINHTKSDKLEIPTKCPICESKTKISEENGVMTLYCENVSCPAKHIKSFVHFASRDAMNIDGLSEATIELLIENHIVKQPQDIYEISKHREKIISLKNFGKKSYDNLISSIEKSKDTNMYRILYAQGIKGIGKQMAKTIENAYQDKDLTSLTKEELLSVDGIGEVLANTYVDYFSKEENRKAFNTILSNCRIKKEEIKKESLNGLTFVITGDVVGYKNRNELKEYLENLGAKVTGSVTKNTSYLINNDKNSTSTKNKTAKSLNVPIIDEEELKKVIEESI